MSIYTTPDDPCRTASPGNGPYDDLPFLDNMESDADAAYETARDMGMFDPEDFPVTECCKAAMRKDLHDELHDIALGAIEPREVVAPDSAEAFMAVQLRAIMRGYGR